MATRAEMRNKAEGSGRAEQTVRLKDAMRSIIKLTAATWDTATPLKTENSAEQILLDTDLDGERYLLVRMPRALGKGAPLSPRELEIVRMVAQGHPNKVIAALLNISSWTVCTHVRRIFAKLGVGSRAAMVARLLESRGIQERALANQDLTFPRSSSAMVTSPPTEPPATALGNNRATPSESQLLHRVSKTAARAPFGAHVSERPSREPRR